MSSRRRAKARSTTAASNRATTTNGPSRATRARASGPATTGRRRWAAVAAAVGIVAVVLAVGLVAVSGGLGQGSSATAGSATASPAGRVVQARGGSWTDISPATLTAMMTTKDFTLLNVKTPYIGEIPGTDLYIPYTQLTSRASELPADKSAPIVVYCRTGNESAIASQTLLDLGYTNIDNLDGGMTAWAADGGRIVQVAR